MQGAKTPFLGRGYSARLRLLLPAGVGLLPPCPNRVVRRSAFGPALKRDRKRAQSAIDASGAVEQVGQGRSEPNACGDCTPCAPPGVPKCVAEAGSPALQGGVVHWRAILDLDVTEGHLTDASRIAIHVGNEEDPAPGTEPAELLTEFMVEIEDTIS